MKIFFFVVSFFFGFGHVIGQTTVSGILLDRSTKEPLIGATIFLFEDDGDPSYAIVSGKDGRFEVETKAEYLLISYVGYEAKRVATVDVDVILMDRSNSFLSDEALIIRADKPTIIEPITMTTLRRSDLSVESPGNTIATLNMVPSIYMQSGGQNTNKLTLRGVGSRAQFATSHVKIFYNEIPLHSSIGESAIEDIGLHMVDRLEVVNGTTGSFHEAGYGGAILLKNKNRMSINRTRLTTNNTVGRWGHLQSQNQISIGRKDGSTSHNLDLYHSSLSSDGYRTNNEVDRHNLTLNYTLNRSGKWIITTLVNHVDLVGFIPSSLSRSDYDDEPTKAAFVWGRSKGNEDYSRTLIGMTFDYNLNRKWSLSNTAYGRRFGSSELRPFNTIDEDYTALGLKGKVHHDQHSDALNTTFSADVGYRLQKEDYNFGLFETVDTIKGGPISDGFEDRWITELYARVAAEINEKWLLTADYNFQYASFSADDNEVLSKGYFLPEVGISYGINPSNRVFARLGQGIQYFSPSDARLPDGSYNQSLEPSIADNLSFGAKGALVDNRLTYRAEIYKMWIDGALLASRDINNQAININGGVDTYSGIELQVDYQLLRNRAETRGLNLSGFYTTMDNQYGSFDNSGVDFGGNIIPGAPQNRFRLAIQGKYDGWIANIRYSSVDSYYMENFNQVTSDAYSLLDAMISYQWAIGGNWKITPRVDFQNITNEKYAAMTLVNASSFGGNAPRYFYPGLPSNIQYSIRVDFKI